MMVRHFNSAYQRDWGGCSTLFGSAGSRIVCWEPNVFLQIVWANNEYADTRDWIEGLEYAIREFKAGVGGDGGRGGEGWCVLVDGEWCMKAAKEDTREKL